MTDRSIVAGVVAGCVRLAAFVAVAVALFGGAVVAATHGGEGALFAYVLAMPLLGGVVGGLVVLAEDRRDARRGPPRMVVVRIGGRRG